MNAELRIPEKLYGRSLALTTLAAAYGRARSGSGDVALVRGPSGIGKSALVEELRSKLGRRTHFVGIKFEQLGSTVPYAPIARACRELVRAALEDGPDAEPRLRARLLEALGPNAPVVVDLVPELALVIGPQPALAAVGPTEAQRRFEIAFHAFLGVFASPEHPLVVFLDDLQWADSASARWVEALLGSQRKHLFVIGSYRDDEVTEEHPLYTVLADLRNAGVTVREVDLRPLDKADLEKLLADTLGRGRDDVRALAALTFDITSGNPFFIRQFVMTLESEQLVTFDAERARWSWNVGRIASAKVTDDLLDFLGEKLRRLPDATQHVLRLAASSGHQFESTTLAVIAERTLLEIEADLDPAIREGLVLTIESSEPSGPVSRRPGAGAIASESVYRFLHDRVQQAAYALIPTSEIETTHLRIGRLLFAKYATDVDEHVFDIVGHMNIGERRISDRPERHMLARLNLLAGQKARVASAHGTAVNLLARCLELLADAGWDTERELLYAAHLTKAECEFALARPEDALDLLDVVEHRAANAAERAAARELRIAILTTMNRMEEAASCGIETARELGEDFPRDREAMGAALASETDRQRAALATRSIESLLDLPPMRDPEKTALLRVLFKSGPPANQTDKALMALLITKGVNLSAEHGNSPVSPYFYVCQGMLSAIEGDFDRAYRFGELGLRLNQNLANPVVDGATQFVFAAFVAHWQRPLAESLECFARGLEASLGGGDHLHAGYCASHRAAYRFFRGDRLSDIDSEIDELTDLFEQTGDVVNRKHVRLTAKLVASLRGSAGDTAEDTPLETDEVDEIDEVDVANGENHFLACSQHVYESIDRYFGSDFTGALEAAKHAEESMIPAFFFAAEHRLYQALARAGALRAAKAQGAAGEDRAHAAILESLRRDEETLRGWAAASPANFAHRHALVAAELDAVAGDETAALAAYDRAIALSREHGAVPHEALANELCGRFQERRKRGNLARPYLIEASRLYADWGAADKAARVRRDAS